MANEIKIVLTQQGFFAGRVTPNGTLSLGAHKISEEEIFTMYGALMRTYCRKTGKDSLMLPGNDGKIIVSKLVEVRQAAAPEEETAAADNLPQKKRIRRAKKAANEQGQDGDDSGSAGRKRARSQAKAE